MVVVSGGFNEKNLHSSELMKFDHNSDLLWHPGPKLTNSLRYSEIFETENGDVFTIGGYGENPSRWLKEIHQFSPEGWMELKTSLAYPRSAFTLVQLSEFLAEKYCVYSD